MTWTTEEFKAVLDTDIAIALFKDEEIAAYVRPFSPIVRAALLHANHIDSNSSYEDAKAMLQLVAAFGRKDWDRINALVDVVKLWPRLDYMLPLHEDVFDGGEDVFVASVKAMCGGSKSKNVHLEAGDMVHKVGDHVGQPYTEDELRGTEDYINNSFAIRRVFASMPKKDVVQPRWEAVEYMIEHARDYRDSNDNPVIVFLPGAIDIDGHPVPEMLADAVKYGAAVNDIGFFGVSGLVWSAIIGDGESYKKLIELNAVTSSDDEFKNQNIGAWIRSTDAARKQDPAYRARLGFFADFSKPEPELKVHASSNALLFR